MSTSTRPTKFDRIAYVLTASFGARAGSAIAAIVWPGYQIGRYLKLSFVNLQLHYEIRVAPFIAGRLSWVLWPAYKLLRASNIRLVVNIADGTGHIISELDNFFRMMRLDEIDKNRRYVWIRKPSDLSTTCVQLYGGRFWWAVSNRLVYAVSLPITMRFKDITVDAGLSRMKWQLTDTNEYHLPTSKGSYLHRIPKADVLAKRADYHKRVLKSAEFFPLQDAAFNYSQLGEFLNGNTEKLALIHIRTNIINATAKATDPETYLDTLAYLAEQGYHLVFVGREKMPAVFQQCDVINYSESRLATFRNDIQLFNMAELAVTAGSGISYLAECFGRPFVYLNYWHIAAPPASRRCVMVPTLVQRQFGEFLSFSQQASLHSSLDGGGAEVFPQMQYEARNATSAEILAATEELVSLRREPRERTPLQERFRRLDGGWALRYSQARCSEYFLQKHRDLL